MFDPHKTTQAIFSEAGMLLDAGLANFLDIAGSRPLSDGPGPFTSATAAVFSAKVIERALIKHGKALSEAAAASQRHALSLTRATWVLAAATIALVVSTVLLALGPR
jgi:hypothetical protein